ncbi:hypothetical protein CMI37_17110 [Candidatus Pacearchaeota archaeon]|nr:hypothetical protein [Candidatus Pacearchaeota archaeon]|tara:strand:+ start:638 stop:1093 length:456 start_codon:yes stop_codon:yes gene_type:complete
MPDQPSNVRHVVLSREYNSLKNNDGQIAARLYSTSYTDLHREGDQWVLGDTGTHEFTNGIRTADNSVLAYLIDEITESQEIRIYQSLREPTESTVRLFGELIDRGLFGYTSFDSSGIIIIYPGLSFEGDTILNQEIRTLLNQRRGLTSRAV